MTEAVKLEAEIDEAARRLQRVYDEALAKMKGLKDAQNALEQTICEDKGSLGDDRVKALESAWESLSRLSDALIIRSKEAWQTCARLERECTASGLELTRLAAMRVLCKNTDALAADLLCYTLGRSRVHKS